MLSFKFEQSDPDDIYQIGFFCLHYNGFSWTEFCGQKTIIYNIGKNYSIIPSFCYDIDHGIILDPVDDSFIKFGLER
jgi:hypothetical protein